MKLTNFGTFTCGGVSSISKTVVLVGSRHLLWNGGSWLAQTISSIPETLKKLLP
jgi:hypothetical protein